MRKILVAVGSGIKGGNTDKLADAFIKGASEKGHQVHKVFLGDTDLHGCRGCAACQKNGNKCMIKDIMQEIYPLVEECDTIVMASPLYFWTLSSQIKAFWDRLYALSVDNRYPYKESVLLMTADDDSAWTFEKPENYYRFITNAIGWKNLGSYLAGGCHGAAEKRYIEEKHLQGAYEFGNSI